MVIDPQDPAYGGGTPANSDKLSAANHPRLKVHNSGRSFTYSPLVSDNPYWWVYSSPSSNNGGGGGSLSGSGGGGGDGGNCQHESDLTATGSRCGKRSADDRPGGR